MDENPLGDRRPTTNHPLNARPRPVVPAVLAVIGLIVAIGVLFLFLTWVRYNS
jgi:hypothetical protein